MILDQVFHGVLNESVGTLEVYDEPTEDVSPGLVTCRGEGEKHFLMQVQPMYNTALDTLKQMGDVVKGLYDKVSLPA